MSFMENEITDLGRHWEVETNSGTWYVPGDVVPVPAWIQPSWHVRGQWLDHFEDALMDYIEPDWSQVSSIRIVTGNCGRMTAPGYLDCTDWSFHRTKRGLRTELDFLRGD